jgi:hypothetical protein
MAHKAHNIGVANQIGKYSDAVETAPNLRRRRREQAIAQGRHGAIGIGLEAHPKTAG